MNYASVITSDHHIHLWSSYSWTMLLSSPMIITFTSDHPIHELCLSSPLIVLFTSAHPIHELRFCHHLWSYYSWTVPHKGVTIYQPLLKTCHLWLINPGKTHLWFSETGETRRRRENWSCKPELRNMYAYYYPNCFTEEATPKYSDGDDLGDIWTVDRQGKEESVAF
jgi:hypothetical protein